MICQMRRVLHGLLVATIVVPVVIGAVLLAVPGQITKRTLSDSVATAVSSGGGSYSAACF